MYKNIVNVFKNNNAQCDQFQKISNRLKWCKKTDIESEIKALCPLLKTFLPASFSYIKNRCDKHNVL